MEGVLTERPSLAECRVAVRESEDAHRNLAKRLESLGLEKVLLEDSVKRLEDEKLNVISGIARNSKKDSDLSKVKKNLDQSRDDLLDKTEIIKATKTALEQAARDLLQVNEKLNREVQRAWRGVVKEISARYSPQVQEIFLKMYIALICSQPAGGAPLFHSISCAFDLQVPRLDLPAGMDEWNSLKAQLEKEFGVV